MKLSDIGEELKKVKELLEEIRREQGEELLCTSEACSYLKMSKSHFYKLTSCRAIPFYKPNGKRNYFRKSDLFAWVTKNRWKTVEEIRGNV